MKSLPHNLPTVEANRRKAIRMLITEELIRIRCQESLREAEHRRWIRRWRAGRWWRWLSRYAAHRADRALR
ncbi:hypothetical protein JOF55_003089 [Haloactinomyces albus]|uniref:Uncharacterized protein n=1 Tax=Haloactinomyces albus TaxID=1352928 RepID=A0AAE4CQQ0_9ACTN|nr:hypothetical protein [Haloactinomyces albus]